ncbi:Retrovirus-related Pol polyprotein from transposon RE1 [Vitis vinifera]|uniref:Retrovirus-related Pol polyprotein from transposon RE1 n=1 Tax=Vitis vinifera TaxID=29760 RepID=A0A438J9U0_VITVI|nr:Retrovirus-related Pol polyprotein from transposon RE1 [Vitis vinifera]
MPFTNDQILASPSVPSLDDVFAHLLHLSSTQTLSIDGPSDSSVLAFQANSRGGRSGNRGRGQPTSASVAQTDNVFVCFTQSPSLGPWILDSGAFDHISGNKHLFSSITTTFVLPTVTLANGSQTMAKGPEYGEDDWHRALSKFQKMVPRFSTLSSLACESCQLGKYTRVSFPKRLNNRAKSHFELVHTDDKLSAKATKCIFLGYSLLRRAIVVIPLILIVIFSPLICALSSSLGLSSSTSCCCSSLSSAEVPDNSPPGPPISPTPPCHLLTICLLLFGKTMVDEMVALHSNGTWDLVSLPPSKSTVGCRWVYTVKVGPNGQVDRLKARLVAKGYTQIYGCDYGDTFSPVAKIASVRLFLSMAAMGVWFSKLRCSIYGLKQSPRAWFGRFSSVVQEFGMLRSEADHSFSIIITLRASVSIWGVSKRSWEISTTCRQTELPHHHSARHLFSCQGMLYEDRGHTQIVGYIDADWAGSPSDRRSTSGYCVFIGGNLISWKSKKQDVVARSSAKAEYRAMTLATCELIWLRQLLQELRFGKDEQIKLVCDNQAALHFASNPVFHERTKHIEVDCHFIREKIVSGCVATSFVNSNDQLADIFTKSLRGPRIKYICNKLGAYDIYAPA